ncbi:DUF5722 domain-containing protein [Paenibacillus nasutitermitis]|uniref:DUF5722 domain-containing protein n=1 Tax=Paenibacillus nasutitermitis TaxID=1652958 RepID=A0A916Z707_9BACL|nr:DUF5722 domain-containing protein [Paenibacillus nasutitermitis]GGD79787.1 hypothetical protein GCM10010911_42350 [Paenibacillus nasutitermitis]
MNSWFRTCLTALIGLAIVLTIKPGGAQTAYADPIEVTGWQFSTAGNAEGWTGNGSVSGISVSNGSLSFTASGSAPALTSGAFTLNASEYNVVAANLKNSTANTQGVLYWTTAADTVFNAAKSKPFSLLPGDGDFTEYQIQLKGHAAWTGQITKLRIAIADSPTATGQMLLDEVRFDIHDRIPVNYVGSTTGVSVNTTTITVAGITGPSGGGAGSQLQLYELAPYQYEGNIGALTPVISQAAPAGGGSFSITIPRFDGSRDRYYSKFLVTEQVPGVPSSLQYIDHPKYATNILFGASHSFTYPTTATKKGILAEMSDDAEELGIDHAVVNVELSNMMYKENLNPSNTLTYAMDGQNYYFRKDTIESLDKQIKTLSDNNIVVNLVLILYPNFPTNSMTDVLHHPNAVLGTGGGVLAFNTVQANGLQAFKAVMEFITDRYTREDQLYGRALGYIVGNEVDAQWEWQNMGYATVNQFVEQYEPAMRIAYLAARKHYADARIYTSLTNHWAKAYDPNPKKGYRGRKLVDLLNRQSKLNGDFPWHVAYHPYPEDFFNTDTWNDALAPDSLDANYITFKNIHILNNYMGLQRLKFGADRRRIILSEQGFHTADNSLATAKNQAAAFAYAYYKTKFLDGIDSLIMFSHVDIPSYGLNMGLWTQDPATTTPMVPKDRKYIYDVFKYIDTKQSLGITDFAKPIIGINDWSEVVPGFNANALDLREPPLLLPMVQETSTPAAASGDNFNTSTDGWIASDNAAAVIRTTADKYAGAGALEVDFSALALKWRGAAKSFATPYNATATPYLRLAVKMTGTTTGLPYQVKVKAYSGDHVAEGVALVDPASGWTSLTLDLKDWSYKNAIDRIKVWAGSKGNSTWTGKLRIDEVSFAASGTATSNNTGVNLLSSYERIVYNFEGSAQEWTAGDNVDSVQSVKTMANTPAVPDVGSYMLEAKFPTAAADIWRTVSVIPSGGLNLTDADQLVYAINSYGGSGGTGYETRVRLHSGVNVLEKTFTISADNWNHVGIDLTGWAYRNSVTKIEISFRAVGTSASWYGSRFQLDTIRFVAHDNLENESNLEALSLAPFWQGTTMYSESVLMVSNAGALPEADLLFPPNAILSVKSARLDREYVQNVDWILDNGKLKLTAQSSIPYLTDSVVYTPSYIPGLTMPRNGGGGVIYREGSYFHDRQIVVTYTHAANVWTGPTPALADLKLTGTFSKLRKGEPIRMVLYGDSISVGANASGFTETPPHLPIWGRMVANELERYYGSDVTFINPSVGGQTSTWGKDQATALVANQHPDLVVIAFGMNDGSGTGAGDGTAPAIFKSNVQSIINSVRAVNPAAEFILVGTTLPNAETFFYDEQPNYYAQLSSLASTTSGVAAADITGVHAKLLLKKKFIDMTGNNINHPNDFLSRWYAQFLIGMLKDTAAVPAQPAGERLLYSFESSVQGWSTGTNTTSVNRVNSFANLPNTPAHGSYVLEAQFPTQAADVWRTIKVTPQHALDLSEAGNFFYRINSYGGSGGTGYETKLRLLSGVNAVEFTTAMNADAWNVIKKDISGWAYKNNVTSIEISFRATGSSATWFGSRFQIDYIGYQTRDTRLYDFEGSLNGWTAGTNVTSVSSVDKIANVPAKPIRNAYALEAIFPTQAANEWRTVSITPGAALNLTGAGRFYYHINSYGGSGGTGYETRLRYTAEQMCWNRPRRWVRIPGIV